MSSDQLKFYLDYRLPVDLRQVSIMPDVDVSYSIGSGLVGFDDRGGISAALAKSWKTDHEHNAISFVLRDNVMWSDGSKITAAEVVDSFADAKVEISKEVPSVFESYKIITALDEVTIRFDLSDKVSADKFLERLCEPMYGLTKKVNGKMDSTVTSGAYSLVKADENQIEFAANKYWYRYNPKMFSTVIARRPKKLISTATLLEDQWPMLVKVPNFILKSELSKIPDSYSTWRRHLDGLFSLRYAGRPTISEYRSLIQFLRTEGDFTNLVNLVTVQVPGARRYSHQIS